MRLARTLTITLSNRNMPQQSLSTFFKPKRPSESAATEQPAPKIAKLASDPDLENLAIGQSWSNCLLEEIQKPYLGELQKFVENERKSKTIYPTPREVFSWSRHCEFEDIKVVILGQDPYHGPNQAHGLCFSVKMGVNPPPSLKNIYKTLLKDIDTFTDPGHGFLIGWARQGVLLLNAVLTVEKSKANSHKGRGWERVTDGVIRQVSKQLNNCVFMLWGGPAKQKDGLIDRKKHLILSSVHPSPLSAHRGFFECGHFSAANKYLVEHGRKAIDWNDLPPA